MTQPKIRAASLYTVNDATIGGDENKVLVDEFRTFATGTASPTPQQIRGSSLTGFDAYSSTDFPGSHYTGITVNGPGAVRSMQLAVDWDAEEDRPTNMFIRVNDDTAVPTAWGAWARVHVGNITFTTSTATPTGGLPGDVVYVY